jgi:hypothetical protein
MDVEKLSTGGTFGGMQKVPPKNIPVITVACKLISNPDCVLFMKYDIGFLMKWRTEWNQPQTRLT